MDNTLRFERFVFVELKLETTPAAGVRQPFLNYPQLQGAYIQAIEAFTDSQVTKTPNQNTVFANAAAKEMLMNFVDTRSNKLFEFLPYYTLIRSNNGGYFFRFKNYQIDIQKSFVWEGGATATVNHSLAFGVYYTKSPVI